MRCATDGDLDRTHHYKSSPVKRSRMFRLFLRGSLSRCPKARVSIRRLCRHFRALSRGLKIRKHKNEMVMPCSMGYPADAAVVQFTIEIGSRDTIAFHPHRYDSRPPFACALAHRSSALTSPDPPNPCPCSVETVRADGSRCCQQEAGQTTNPRVQPHASQFPHPFDGHCLTPDFVISSAS